MNLASLLGTRIENLKDVYGILLDQSLVQTAFSIIMKNFKEMDQSLVGDGIIFLATLPLVMKKPRPEVTQKIIQAIATPLSTKNSRILTAGFVLVTCSCIAVDPGSTLSFLSQANMMTAFVHSWLDDSAIEPSYFYRQISILAITELLREPSLWKYHNKFTWKVLSQSLYKRFEILSEVKQLAHPSNEVSLEPIYFSIEGNYQPATSSEIDEEKPQEGFSIKSSRLSNELRTLLSLIESQYINDPLRDLNLASYLKNSLLGSLSSSRLKGKNG